jgi:WhiB family redox-sensing transcriptional regulator
LKSTQLLQISNPFDGTQLCIDVDTDIFFPEQYEPEDVAQAKSICSGCWMQEPCLEFALRTNEKEGVWGGTTPADRRRIRRRVKK